MWIAGYDIPATTIKGEIDDFNVLSWHFWEKIYEVSYRDDKSFISTAGDAYWNLSGARFGKEYEILEGVGHSLQNGFNYIYGDLKWISGGSKNIKKSIKKRRMKHKATKKRSVNKKTMKKKYNSNIKKYKKSHKKDKIKKYYKGKSKN